MNPIGLFRPGSLTHIWFSEEGASADRQYVNGGFFRFRESRVWIDSRDGRLVNEVGDRNPRNDLEPRRLWRKLRFQPRSDLVGAFDDLIRVQLAYEWSESFDLRDDLIAPSLVTIDFSGLSRSNSLSLWRRYHRYVRARSISTRSPKPGRDGFCGESGPVGYSGEFGGSTSDGGRRWRRSESVAQSSNANGTSRSTRSQKSRITPGVRPVAWAGAGNAFVKGYGQVHTRRLLGGWRVGGCHRLLRLKSPVTIESIDWPETRVRAHTPGGGGFRKERDSDSTCRGHNRLPRGEHAQLRSHQSCSAAI